MATPVQVNSDTVAKKLIRASLRSLDRAPGGWCSVFRPNTIDAGSGSHGQALYLAWTEKLRSSTDGSITFKFT